MVRPRLAKGDDGSANRYPVRIIDWDSEEGIAHIAAHVPITDAPVFMDDSTLWIDCSRCGKNHRANVCPVDRHYCPTCGLFHRAICPSGPGVADILSAPTPESFDLRCEDDYEPYPGRIGHLCGGQARCTCP